MADLDSIDAAIKLFDPSADIPAIKPRQYPPRHAAFRGEMMLSRAISDVGLYEFRRQTEYKAERSGAKVIFASRWFPSSKTCSACGCIRDKLPLNVREWTCEHCGAHHDRDINAAINLRNLAASSAVAACGENSADDELAPIVKLASAKQEYSGKATYE